MVISAKFRILLGSCFVMFLLLISKDIKDAEEEPDDYSDISNGSEMKYEIKKEMAPLPDQTAGSLQKLPQNISYNLDSSRTVGDCQTLGFNTGAPLPLTALASTPGSGNTWLRYLLQQATGIYTGSEYFDKSLKKSGFHGEGMMDGQVLGIKTHELRSEDVINYDKAILLVRHPQGSILSEFNRRNSHYSHTGVAPENIFSGTKWKSHVKKATSYWRKFTRQWLEFEGPLLVVHYEHLQADLRTELLRMLDFLHVNITRETLECVVKNSQGSHKREPNTLAVDPFTDSMKMDIANAWWGFSLMLKHTR